MDLTGFRSTYPEFLNVPDGAITSAIAFSASELGSAGAAVWGTTLDTAVGLWAAHLLAMSPGGQFARMDPTKGVMAQPGTETTYGRQFIYLRDAATSMRRFF